MKVQYMKRQMKSYKSIVYEKYKNVDKSTGQYKIGYMKVYDTCIVYEHERK